MGVLVLGHASERVHDVTDRYDPGQPTFVDDGQVSNPVLRHDLYDVSQIVVGRRLDHVARHHPTDFKGLELVRPARHETEDVPFRENSDDLSAIYHDHATYIVIDEYTNRVEDTIIFGRGYDVAPFVAKDIPDLHTCLRRTGAGNPCSISRLARRRAIRVSIQKCTLTGEYERMKRPLFASNLCVALLVTLGACGDNDNGIDFGAPPPGPYRLTLEGDESFQGPHGGHSINVVVVNGNLGGLAVAEGKGIISFTNDISFDFGFARLLAEGVDHDVYYWIDSNIGGGNVGTCDPPEIDHQWTSAVRNPRANIEIAHSHNDADNIDVCFAFSLSSPE